MGPRYRLLLLWHTVSYYARMRRPIALVRAVSRVVFFRDNGELCQRCGRSYVLWYAERDLYKHVHGNTGGLYCPTCFDRAAEANGKSLIWLPQDFLDWHAQRDTAPSGSPQEGPQ